MDQEKRRAERRRNVLENAEARLRFIKEGIPWRNTEINYTEDNSQQPQSLKSEASVKSPVASVDSSAASVDSSATSVDSSATSVNNFTTSTDSSATSVNSSSTSVNSSAISVDSSAIGVDSSSTSVYSSSTSVNSSSTSVDNSSTSVDSYEKAVPTPQSKPSQADCSCSRLHPVPTLESPQREEVESGETVQRLSRLIEESERERGDRKKDGEEMARRSLHDCILMLCLGVAVRLSYSLNISTLFYQLMMVPFIGVATVRLIDTTKRPPVINSLIMRLLMMIPLRNFSINWTLTVLSTLRTGLQLFSVYLVAFVFTHTLVTSDYDSV